MIELSVGRKTRKAYQLYKKKFSNQYLSDLYEDRISLSHAVGKDGVRQSQFRANIKDEINIIIKKTDDKTYRFTRYKEKLISKGAERFPRVISIPTIRDRLTLRVTNDILCEVFRDARIWRPHVYIKQITELMAKDQKGISFVRIDIKDFYPSIEHDTLVRKVRSRLRKKQLIHLISSAISTPTFNSKPLTRGVPQGLSISNILSSIYLMKVDEKFSKKYSYFRYVDDILVITDSEKAEGAFREIEKELKKLGLEVHPLDKDGKSNIAPVYSGIDYLGFRITPNAVSVRESSYRRMVKNLLGVFTEYKHKPESRKNLDQLVWRLNLKITGCIFEGRRFGWVFFFSQINDLRQLGRLDDLVSQQLKLRKLEAIEKRTKKFLRTYHEIRKNLSSTLYIPKFDDLTIEEMIRQLSLAEGHPIEHYEIAYSERQIRSRFYRLVERQTRMLERDLIEVFS